MADPAPRPDLAAALAAELAARGLSGAELARRAGVSQSVAQAVLAGRDPRLSTVRRLLAGLNRDLAWLARQTG